MGNEISMLDEESIYEKTLSHNKHIFPLSESVSMKKKVFKNGTNTEIYKLSKKEKIWVVKVFNMDRFVLIKKQNGVKIQQMLQKWICS